MNPPDIEQGSDSLTEVDLIEGFAIVSVLLLASIATFGVALAMLGAFDGRVTATAATLLVLPIVVWTVHRSIIRISLRLSLPAAVALVSAVVLAWLSVNRVGHPVLIRRDPGSYFNTARWIARHGNLRVSTDESLLAGIPGVRFDGPAVYDVGGHLEFQFSHGFSTVMATAFDLVGPRGIIFANVGIGIVALLAVFTTARRLGTQPWVALGVMVAVGISIPFLYVTRSTYSEPLVMALVWIALTLLLIALSPTRSTRPATAPLLGASFLVGSTVVVRIDGLLYVAALCAALAVVAIHRDVVRLLYISLLAAAVPAVVGTINLMRFSGNYATDLEASLRPLMAMMLGMVALAIAAGMFGRHRPVDSSPRELAAAVSGAAVTLAVLAAWLVRPRVLIGRTEGPKLSPSESLIAGLQQAEGLEVDSRRTYAEVTVLQFEWYLGPLFVSLAAIGFGILARRWLRRPGGGWAAVAAFSAIALPLYLWRPSIFPDQPWMSRRYVPFVLPSFAVAAGLAITWVTGRINRPVPRVLTTVALALGVVVPTAIISWPVRDMSDDRGSIIALLETCEIVQEGSTALVIDIPQLPQAIRSWCGADVGRVDGQDIAAVDMTIDRAQDRCATLVVIGPSEDRLATWASDLEPVRSIASPSVGSSELTLMRAPQTLIDRELSLAVARVRLPGRCD